MSLTADDEEALRAAVAKARASYLRAAADFARAVAGDPSAGEPTALRRQRETLDELERALMTANGLPVGSGSDRGRALLGAVLGRRFGASGQAATAPARPAASPRAASETPQQRPAPAAAPTPPPAASPPASPPPAASPPAPASPEPAPTAPPPPEDAIGASEWDSLAAAHSAGSVADAADAVKDLSPAPEPEAAPAPRAESAAAREEDRGTRALADDMDLSSIPAMLRNMVKVGDVVVERIDRDGNPIDTSGGAGKSALLEWYRNLRDAPNTQAVRQALPRGSGRDRPGNEGWRLTNAAFRKRPPLPVEKRKATIGGTDVTFYIYGLPKQDPVLAIPSVVVDNDDMKARDWFHAELVDGAVSTGRSLPAAVKREYGLR